MNYTVQRSSCENSNLFPWFFFTLSKNVNSSSFTIDSYADYLFAITMESYHELTEYR